MKKIVGFNLIYPEGCKEVTDGLKIDELKRRLADLMKSLEETQFNKPFSTESLLNSTDVNINENTDLKMEGLLLHLTSEMFIDHEDIDVQLRVAVCICNILKLYCPINPFLSFSDSKSRIKTVLDFLLKCLNEMVKLKSKSDRNFLNLYKIFSISCETNVFHCFIMAEDGEKIFVEYVRTMFSIAKKFPDWAEDNKPMQMLCDALVVLISSHEISVPDKLVTYILNFLADRCATKEQKQLSIDIINRCLNKLEDPIQTILRNYLIKSEMEDDLSDSSDNEEADDIDDDFCSMPEYRIINRKQEQKLEKSKPKKLEKNKNTIETCVEYSCDHTFQLVYELFKISAALVTPLLPTVEMKLRSPNNVTDRKRACRLLGKLFISYIPSSNSSHSSLWECFLGRFCDIELEVREICVRVARDVLKRAISGDDISGILSIPTSKEDLVKALQKRSHDQEESIRYQLVVSISQIFEKSKSIIADEELDFVNEMLFKILIDRTRDKCMIVRKEANASLGKLYRRILTAASESGSTDNRNPDFITGLGNLLPGQRGRLELLLTQILRLYLRVEVEDKIVVERLFNTFLVPYNMDSTNRMKALFHCFIISDDASLMSIQELFKTQVMIMNVLRETVHLIKDSNAEKVLSPSVSQKLKEKVKRLGEYLPSKDKIESLSKFFVMIRSDKKLMEIMLKLVNPDSPRDVIVKSISEVKKHFNTTKPGVEPNPASIQKKKVFASTIKCLLERSAPIIMDIISGQELISFLVSSKEAIESSKHTEEYTISVSRALKLIHVISIIYRNSLPTQESYEYIASIISQFDLKKLDTPIEAVQNDFLDDKQLTPSSTKSLASFNSTVSTFKDIPATIEELCLLTLARIIGSHPQSDTSLDMDDDKFSACTDNTKSLGLFSDETEPLMDQTWKVVQYLLKCATIGSTYPQLYAYPRSPDANKNKDRKNFPLPSDEGDREQCLWKYNCRIAKLATRCLIGLYVCCQHESRLELSMQSSKILAMLENHLDGLVKNSSQCELFSSTQSILLSTLSQIGLNLRRRYGTDIHSYVQNTVLMRILTSDNESSSTELTESRNLSSWVSNNTVSIATQVKIQALKMLSKWMVTLKVEEDRNLILSVMVCLRKYIGSYGNEKYSGSITDGDMAQMRLAAGKCWLRLAQVQSFLSIFDVKWLHRLSGLIYDQCNFVREGFLRKLHKGLFRLQLPLDYMAMFAFVPLVQNSEYQTMAKNFFAANVTRRREFLERNPQYQTDAKLLFAVLPEYVLAFIIHMLAHDEHWVDVDDQPSIHRVKQCLWFVMEPILKMNENSSFIRKLLEKIKHAQDATDPNNTTVNEKLYICCDISLGLLISKQASYDLKEYPVELKLPRTRYIPAPNTFFNPDFANILIGDPPKVRIQFSPTHKSKQMIMNFMPAPLIKGHMSGLDNNNSKVEDSEVHIQKPIVPVKPKKHIAKIVVGLPEIESEGISGQISPPQLPPSINNTTSPKKQINVRKVTTKRKNTRNTDSPVFELEEFENNPTSVTKRGRICKPNVRVMKDMVSLSRKPNVSNNPIVEKNEISNSNTTVLIEGNVSVNLERITGIDSIKKYDFSSDELDKENSSDFEQIDNEIKSPILKKNKSPNKVKRINNRSPIQKFVKTAKSTLNKPIKNVLNKNVRKSAIIENKSPENNEKAEKVQTKVEKKSKKKVVIVNPPETLPKQNNIAVKEKGDLKIVDSPRKLRNSIRVSVDNITEMIETKKSKEKVTKSKIVTQKIKTITNSQESKSSDSSPRRSRSSIKGALNQVENKADIAKESSDSKSIPTTPPPMRKTRSSQDTTQSSSDSAILNQLTKQILTRKASSIKPMKIKDMPMKNRSSSIVLDVERTPVKSKRKSLENIIDSPSTPKVQGRPKKLESTPKSPIEIISRSKRVASQAATDTLIKKTRNI